MIRIKKRLNMFIWIFLITGTLLALIIQSLSSPGHQAKKAAHLFYSFEQRGDFASSWELFHSNMKGKFTKAVYIQDRSHVFMNHFGVETFTYTLSKPQKLKIEEVPLEAPASDLAYKMTVIQTYESKYGHLEIHQDIIAVKEEEGWRILWVYND